jgi:uncharacterized membrane protein YesL
LDDNDLPILDKNTYVKESFLALWFALPRVLWAGFLFSLVSFPAVFLGLFLGFLIPGILLGVVSIGAGWLALNAVIARAILRENHPSLLDFFRDFAHFYLRGLILGGMMSVPFIAAAGTLPLLQQNPVPVWAWVGLCADAAGIFFLTAIGIYACPLIVMIDLGVRTALMNGVVLAGRYLSHTLGMVGLAVLLCLLTVRVSVLLILILPAFWSVFVINNCRLVLRLESGNPQP